MSVDIMERGRAGGVDFVNLLVGWGAVGSVCVDLPKEKSLLKNPDFLIFC